MGLFDFLGGGGNNTNPADVAMPYLNKIPGTVKPYYDPYINAGNQSLSSLMGQYGNLINDPGALMNKMASGYQQSPGYQFNYNQGMNAVNNAAAAGGMLGTPSHQMDAGKMASNLANQDYNNYLGNVLGMYKTGLGGMGDVTHLGYGASNDLASILSSNLMNQAGLAFQGQANQNQSSNDLIGALTKIAGGVSQFF